MKKIMTLFVAVLFGVVLAACGKDSTTTTTSTTKATTTQTTTSNQTTTTNTTANQTTTTQQTATTAHPNATVVTIASWAQGGADADNLFRRQVAKFNETHSDIQIEIVDYTTPWMDWLTAKAAANEFPDIISTDNVPGYAIKDWTADISDVLDNEWNSIPQDLRNSVTYNGKVYGIPSAYNYMGYFANLDLLGNVSAADFANFDYSDEDFFQAVEDLKNTNVTDGSGTIGIMNVNDIINWYPSVLDATGNTKNYIWNGTGFDFMGDPIKQAMAKTSTLFQGKYSFDSYSDATSAENPTSLRAQVFGQTWDGGVFRAGQMGFLYSGMWDAQPLVNDIGDLFNVDFVGVPDGRVIGVPDYYAISKTAANKEAAYEVVKYLTFGEQGIKDTFDIIDAAKTEGKNFSMNGLPLNTTLSQDLVDKWFATFPMPGYKKAYEKLAAGQLTILVEGNKYVPGFWDAKFGYNTGIDSTLSLNRQWATGQTLSIGDFMYDAAQGAISYNDYMTKQVADAINAEFMRQEIQLLSK